MDKYIDEIVMEANNGVINQEGGPFGAVVVDRNGKIIGKGHNTVLKDHDPTCHAEVNAIRDACKNIGSHKLNDCIIVTVCEPCPMCLSTIIWSNIKKVYYASTRSDAARIGFRDEAIYDYLGGKDDNLLTLEKFSSDSCRKLFDDYKGEIY